MPSAFAALFRLFLTPVGLPALAALDASVIFFFPFGLDLALALMSARNESLAWLYPLLATAGSVAGAAFTFWLGRKIGEHGVERFVDANHLDHVKRRIGARAAVSSGFLALIPPPFPFTAFILVSGAFDVSFRAFLAAFVVARLIRGAIVIALAGTAYSAWRVVRARRR